MKVCPKCSTENSDFDWYCENCGAALPSKTDPVDEPKDLSAKFTPPVSAWERAKAVLKDAASQQAGGREQRSHKQENGLFIDPGEELRAAIGSGYVRNFLAGGTVGRSVGVLTQKRFYYKGKNCNTKSKLLWTTEEEGVVSVDDISCTGYSYTSATGLLIIGVALALLGFIFLVSGGNTTVRIMGAVILLLGALALVRYYLSRDTLFIVSFPGGSFGFDTKWYSGADIQDFQRQLHLIKDQRKGETVK